MNCYGCEKVAKNRDKLRPTGGQYAQGYAQTHARNRFKDVKDQG